MVNAFNAYVYQTCIDVTGAMLATNLCFVGYNVMPCDGRHVLLMLR